MENPSTPAHRVEHNQADQQRQKREHRLLAWKQNIPYLYDSFLQAALPQPCSCMEWLVGKDWEVKMEDWAVSHMVLGTSSRDASEEFNQLLVNWVVRQPDPAAGTAAQDSDSFELPLQPHDPVHTVMAFAHPAGPVSAVSVLPHIPHLAVTKVSEGDGDMGLYLYDLRPAMPLSSHSEEEMEQAAAAGPVARVGPSTTAAGAPEGPVLQWSPAREGLLASSCTGGGIAVLQVHDNTLASIPRSSQDGRAPTLSIACPQLYRGQHPQGVNDIAFATPAFSDHVLASVGEGGELVLWDIREQQPTAVVKQAHSQAANTVRFHPGIPGYLVTGGADGALHICDVRKLASAADPDRLQPVQTFRSHRCSVLHAVFDTQHPGLLATADEDARIFVWDLELTVKAQEDLLSPPQLRMIHPGHASDVLAMAWCPAPGSAPCMASLSAAWGEDYTLQVWSVARDLLATRPEG